MSSETDYPVKSNDPAKMTLEETKARLATIEQSYALARYQAQVFSATLKLRREAAQRAFDEQNAELLSAVIAAMNASDVLGAEYRELCLAVFEGDKSSAAALTKTATVKEFRDVAYSEADAVRYCVEHKLNQFLLLDDKAFRQAAPHLRLPFVEIEKELRVSVAQDMVKALGLSTDEVDRHINQVLSRDVERLEQAATAVAAS